jgi:hypothetical protein
VHASRGLDVGSLYVAGVLLDTVVEAAVFIPPYEKDYTDPYWISAFNLTRKFEWLLSLGIGGKVCVSFLTSLGEWADRVVCLYSLNQSC